MFMFTYYFGYFKLKWRRLIRTILLFAFIYFFNPAYDFFWDTRLFSDEIIWFVVLPSAHFIVFGLISWILEPFVITKKNSVFFQSQEQKPKD